MAQFTKDSGHETKPSALEDSSKQTATCMRATGSMKSPMEVDTTRVSTVPPILASISKA